MDAIEDLLDLVLATRFEELPPAVVDRTRLAFLDVLGISFAGLRAQAPRAVEAALGCSGGAMQATSLVSGRRLPLPVAANVNAVAARAWDLDDVHEQNTCHVFASIVPAALALAESRTLDGGELIAAAAVGAEVLCRLSSAPRISFSETGSSLTYQCAHYAVALMAARILGLDREQARNAAGIAHARVAGNQQGFMAGAMTISVMQGVSVEGGLAAALLAQHGVTGSHEVLEGRFGYYPIFHRGRYERDALVGALGQRWNVPDISFKSAAPCCKYTHAPYEAVMLAMRELAIGAADVESIRIRVTNREVHDLVCVPREGKWSPRSLVDAQFSLPFAIAHAAVHGRVDLHSFEPEGLQDPVVRALMRRIDVDLAVDSGAQGRGVFPMPGVVTVRARDGRSRDARVEFVRGHPRNPMRFDDVAAKFRCCAAFGRPQWQGGEALVGLVRRLHEITDVRSLVAACEAG